LGHYLSCALLNRINVYLNNYRSQLHDEIRAQILHNALVIDFSDKASIFEIGEKLIKELHEKYPLNINKVGYFNGTAHAAKNRHSTF